MRVSVVVDSETSTWKDLWQEFNILVWKLQRWAVSHARANFSSNQPLCELGDTSLIVRSYPNYPLLVPSNPLVVHFTDGTAVNRQPWSNSKPGLIKCDISNQQSRTTYDQKELWTTTRREPKHQKRQGAHVSLEIWFAGWRWDRSGGACCKDNPLSSHCVSSSAPGLKTTRLVTMKLLFQMTAPPGNRRLPVPIWSKYGVGWSRYAPPFFVFSTIDAPSKGHWVRVVNNVRCA